METPPFWMTPVAIAVLILIQEINEPGSAEYLMELRGQSPPP